jgi:hypothetical protein
LLLYAAAALYGLGLLWLDARTGSIAVQLGLGALTLALLLLLSRQLTVRERRRMGICVVFSTCMELFATRIWGLYRYRMGHIPLFVPPGHGVIYTFSALTVRSPLRAAQRRWVCRLALLTALAWAALGLTLLARLEGRPDLHGLTYLPFFAGFVARSPRALGFAVTFFIASFVEIVGTQMGNWSWSPLMPLLALPSGDPPSVVAGGYCFFALIAEEIEQRLPGRGPRRVSAHLSI